MFNNSLEKFVVIGDLHGRADKARTVYDSYRHTVDGFVVTGDIFDGPDTKETVSVVLNYLNAVVVAANHEQYPKFAMFHEDEDLRSVANIMWRRRVHDNVFSSYGINPNAPTPANTLRLQERMGELGHLACLTDSVPFFETRDLAVVHGSLTGESWPKQKRDLRHFHQNYMTLNSLEMPYQMGEGVKYAESLNIALSGLNKILISGHFHTSTRNPVARRQYGDKHIFLATQPKDDFVAVYESWTDQVKILDLN